MASRPPATALLGARPMLHAPAADTKCRTSWKRTRLSLRRRSLIARASSCGRPQHPSFASEEGAIPWLRSAAAALAIAAQIAVSLPAEAVLYSPDTSLPRTGELALRRAIPANPNMKAIQESLEDISYLLRIPQRKPYGTMEGDVKKAMKIAMDTKDAILGSIPAELKDEGGNLYTALLEGKGGLQTLMKYIKENDPDRLSIALASSLDTVAELELLQAPGLSFLLPQQYLEYPR